MNIANILIASEIVCEAKDTDWLAGWLAGNKLIGFDWLNISLFLYIVIESYLL